MTNFDRYLPLLIHCESGIPLTAASAPSALYAKAAQRGVDHVKHDRGGATLVGVTLDCFQAWRTQQGHPLPTARDLAQLTFTEWRALVKTLFWDKLRADDINDPNVALALVDWAFTSGRYAPMWLQRIVGTTADGIIGAHTLRAVNERDGRTLFRQLQQQRELFFQRIVERDPTQARFLRGWLNRVKTLNAYIASPQHRLTP